MRVPARVAWRDDRGQAGGIEVLPFGVLVFVVGSLLVVNAWGVIDAKFATDSAAREAARAFVETEAPSVDADLAGASATRAAEDAIGAHGREPDRSRVEIIDLAPDGVFERCARVTIAVTYSVPAIRIPFIGGYGEAFSIRSTHSEIVDPFRDGVPGVAEC
jgi:hypothetical protein